jgi:hypothetical protein
MPFVCFGATILAMNPNQAESEAADLLITKAESLVLTYAEQDADAALLALLVACLDKIAPRSITRRIIND